MKNAFIVLVLAVLQPIHADAAARTTHFYRGLRPPAAPQRIVSLAPVATEILNALQGDDQIVGVTKFCEQAPGRKATVIGGYIDPQLELIVSLKPDLVISMPSMGAQLLFEHLHRKNIPVLVGFGDTIAELKGLVTAIGGACGKATVAAAAVLNFDKSLSQLRPTQSMKQIPSVLVVVGSNPLVVAGPASFIGEIISLIGVKSVARKEGNHWQVWPLEALLIEPPDLIIDIQGPAARAQLENELRPLLKNPKFRHTKIISPAHPILQTAGVKLPADAAALKKLISESM